MRPLVLFHAGCPDGSGAALAAWFKHRDGADYKAINYGNPAPSDDEVRGREVYVLDFSFSRIECERLAAVCDLKIVDHHRTAEEALRGLPYATFDMDHSGAVLAWKHFHPDTEIPILFEYLEDRDLWRWKLPMSKEISAALHSRGGISDFKRWRPYVAFFPESELISEGVTILRARNEMVEVMVDKAERIMLDGIECLATNATCLFSEVPAELLTRQKPLSVAWHWDGKAQVYRVSLRSIGDFDCSEIAKKFGGGGHKNAAGFNCNKLPWISKREELT